MPRPRGIVRTLLLAVLWGVSLAALCVTLVPSATVTDAPGWQRTLPDSGAWFLAALALGLGYAFLGRIHRAFAKPWLWLAALLLAGVAALGESFASVGTAELVTAHRGLALFFLVGRALALYMGMALLAEVLGRPVPSGRSVGGVAGAEPPPVAGEREARPVYPAHSAGMQPGRLPPAEPRADGRMPGGAPAARAASEASRGARMPAVLEARPGTRPPVPDARPDSRASAASGARPTARVPSGSDARVAARVHAATAARDAARMTAASDARLVTRTPPAEPYPAYPARYGADPARPTGAPAARLADRSPAPAATRAARAGTPRPADAVTAETERPLPTWGFMLLLLGCWLPYLWAVWPGTVSNDSITQLAEIFGVKPLSNGNPVFQTGLVWLAVSVGQGLFHSADLSVALYALAQAALMAWLLGYALRRMQEARAPRWLVGVSAAFYALCPVFPLFAFCMGKDTSFAMAVLWFTLMAWRAVGSKWPPFRTVAGLCLSAVLCALLRNAGAALSGVTLVALLLWGAVRGGGRWRAPLAALLSVAGAMAMLYAAVLPALGALPTPETENWSVPLQQVARVVASESLTDAQRATIDAVMPVDEIQPAYNGELSDPVKNLWRDGVTPEQRTAFFELWARFLLRYPATCLSATFHNTYGYLLPGYVSTIKPTFLLGMEGRTTLIDGLFDFTVNPRADALKAALQSLFRYAPFRLLTAPGAYGALALFALAAMLTLRRGVNALLALPALLTLLGCLFSAVNGYYRYAMPLYFLAPVLLTLTARENRGALRR